MRCYETIRQCCTSLPDDICREIMLHVHAMHIQSRFRSYQLRFVRGNAWSRLRRLLVSHEAADDMSLLERLFRDAYIRREWTTEPESWIYMLEYEPRVLRAIVDDLK